MFFLFSFRRWYNVFEIVSPQSISGIDATLVKQTESNYACCFCIAFCIWIVFSTNEKPKSRNHQTSYEISWFFFYRLSSTEKSSSISRFSVAVESMVRYQNMIGIILIMFCVHFFYSVQSDLLLNASAAMLLNTHFCPNLIQMQLNMSFFCGIVYAATIIWLS